MIEFSQRREKIDADHQPTDQQMLLSIGACEPYEKKQP
jgi:hypothetical protein